MDDLERFRREIRAFLEASCPPSLRTPAPEDEDVWGGRRAVFKHPDAKGWLDRMAARGLTAPTWPRAYGGGGLSPAEAAILDAEQKSLGCRMALKSFGVWMLGPVLLRFGSEEQKREHLPKIVRGEIRWCQGYSEPGAGSDLASLSMRAERDGDDYVVTGQKTWTSHADKADWMFCLVRTDPAAPKHQGIGFLLIDLGSPGVSVRPIKLLSGASPFCETFFDEVRVPAKNLVGSPSGGWTVAKALLEHERSLISNSRSAGFDAEAPLEEIARRSLGEEGGRIGDPILRDRVAQVNLDQLCYRITVRRATEAEKPGPETSMLKLYGTELNKRRRDLEMLCAGFAGLGWEGPGFEAEDLARTRVYLRSRANTIEGGSSEIQLNIIAKRILGLPD